MYRTADEAKAEHVAKMGTELGELYSALWQEIAVIHSKWAEYVALFGTSPERIELLNKVAPRFFRGIQDSLWEDILLHLARLTDSHRSMGKENLSIRRLPLMPALRGMSRPIEPLVAAALDATEFARDWRNRKLAHSDLALTLGLQVQALASASRMDVRQALQTLSAVMNRLSEEFLDATNMFESDDADALSLMHVIRDGLRHEEERRQRIESGQMRPEDLDPKPL